MVCDPVTGFHEAERPDAEGTKFLANLRVRLAAASADLGEVARALEKTRSSHEVRVRIERVLEGLRELERSIDDQLALERLPSRDPIQRTVDVVEVARGAVRRRAKQSSTRQSLCFEAGGHCSVRGEAELLGRLVDALLACALEHGAPHQPIVVDLEQDARSATLSVIAQGCAGDKRGCPCEKHLAGNEERLSFCRRLAAAIGAEVTTSHAFQLGVRYAVVLEKAG
jgi:signal transduction histidine kinase